MTSCEQQIGIWSRLRETAARFRAVLGAFMEGMEYSGFDYLLDRITNNEKEIARLTALLERAGIDVAPNNETPKQ
jgi:hypothetical protein